MSFKVINVRKITDKFVRFDLLVDGLGVLRNMRYFPERKSVAGADIHFTVGTGDDAEERVYNSVNIDSTAQSQILEQLS